MKTFGLLLTSIFLFSNLPQTPAPPPFSLNSVFTDKSPIVKIKTNFRGYGRACGSGFVVGRSKIETTNLWKHYILTVRHLFTFIDTEVEGSTIKNTERSAEKDIELEFTYGQNIIKMQGLLLKVSNEKYDHAIVSFIAPIQWPTVSLCRNFCLTLNEDLHSISYTACGPQIYTRAYYTGAKTFDSFLFIGDISGGASGSPILNKRGEVVGIVQSMLVKQFSYLSAIRSDYIYKWIKQQDIADVLECK